MSKKKRLSVDELAAKYDEFIKGKELNKNGKNLFNKVIKKAATAKPRASK